MIRAAFAVAFIAVAAATEWIFAKACVRLPQSRRSARKTRLGPFHALAGARGELIDLRHRPRYGRGLRQLIEINLDSGYVIVRQPCE